MRRHPRRLFVLFPLGAYIFILFATVLLHRPSMRYAPAHSIKIKLFQNSKTGAFKFARDTNGFHNTDGRDYGGLDLSFPVSGGRTINQDISSLDNGDDDTKIYKHYEFQTKIKCQDVAGKKKYRPNCNLFHEIDLVDEDDNVGYINSGFYRDVFSFTRNLPDINKHTLSDAMALKILSLKHNVTRETMLDINTEALVMEGLTMSPRIMNIYGHCSTTVGSEFVDNEIEKNIVPLGYMASAASEGKAAIEPQNKLNAKEKLNIALEMARSIADLHGFKNGVVVHDDVQLRQWLRAKDGRLVLGDFNRAKIMRWNDEDKEYCKFRSGKVFGDYRSPEEYRGDKLDEKVDVYSYGNNIYALLTGLWPFYDAIEMEDVQIRIKQGELPIIDDRYRTGSDEERLLVNVMENCWKFNSSERTDIFTVVEQLEDALNEKSVY